MNCRIFGIEPNSTVDGPGVRMAIFFQGCLRHCNGCHNPQSWPLLAGEKMDTEDIKKKIAADPLLTGISLTGGEPFLQPVAALDLAKFAHERSLTVWCWSGYTWEWMQMWDDTRKALLHEVDVLVDGPFELGKKTLDLPWRGSSNQRIIDVQASLKKGEMVLWEEVK